MALDSTQALISELSKAGYLLEANACVCALVCVHLCVCVCVCMYTNTSSGHQLSWLCAHEQAYELR